MPLHEAAQVFLVHGTGALRSFFARASVDLCSRCICSPCTCVVFVRLCVASVRLCAAVCVSSVRYTGAPCPPAACAVSVGGCGAGLPRQPPGDGCGMGT